MYENLGELLAGKTGEQIIDALPVAVYATDSAGRLKYFNSAAVRLSGRKPEPDIDRWCIGWKLYYPDETPMAHDESAMALSLKEGRNIDGMEAILERPNGERVWFKAYPTLLYNKKGTIIGGINLLTNITGQKEAENRLRQKEQALSKSEEKYRTLFETMNVGLVILKMEFNDLDKPIDWQYLETNPAFKKHTGLYDIVGKKASEVLPRLKQDWLKRYGRVVLTGNPVRFEDCVDELDSCYDVSAFRMGKPEDRSVAVFFKNITKRKQAQKEREKLLRRVETERERLAEIFQHAPSAMCIHRGPDHIIERANDFYMQAIGNRKVIGKPVREAFPDLEGQGYFELLDQVYKTGKPFKGTDMKVMLHHPNMEQAPDERYIDLVYQPMRDADESISGVFLQGVDLTERNQAQKELKEMNENLEERVRQRTQALLSYQNQLRSLAAELSKTEENLRQQLATELHDNLGQLLALSKMKVDLLQQDPFSAHPSKTLTDLKEIIDDALRYTRELMSDLKPPPSSTNDIRASIDWVAKKLEKRGLSVAIEDDKKPKPLGKEERAIVYQCVRELLFNVIKHTSEKKAVVSLKSNENQLQISVKDKGEGFDVETMNEEKGGRFGLFNVRERIDLLGGHVDIKSKRGKGSKITLFVPLEAEKITEISEQAKEAKQVNNITVKQTSYEDKIKVLLVDDHQMVRKGFRTMIEDQDDIMVIGEADNGEEAINLTRETSPDIILMDINMPGMNGIEATRKITEEMPGIHIIGLSLHDEERVAEDMRSAGATAYLTKSEAFESLIGSIRAEAYAS